jgi:hypothetical protein
MPQRAIQARTVPTGEQCCQMAYFQTKSSNLGKVWRILQNNKLVYFMAIWYTLHQFGIFYGHLVYSVFIWYFLWSFEYFSFFGMLYQEKSGNPAGELQADLEYLAG